MEKGAKGAVTTEKKPKYVVVYDRLYKMIQDGHFPRGTWLPSEHELARQMGVSRMTLRQALGLLQDDKLLRNLHGKGSLVLDDGSRRSLGLETIAHPVHSCCKNEIDEVECDLRLELPSAYYTDNLGYKTAAVVVSNRWYLEAGTPRAYSLSFLPIETASHFYIDLGEPDKLKQFLERDIYEAAHCSRVTCVYTQTGSFTNEKHPIEDCDNYTMIQEHMYDAENHILAVNKHYIPTAHCELVVFARQAAGESRPISRKGAEASHA